MTATEAKLRPIELPAPVEDRTLSFWEAVAQRRTIREIAATPLTLAQLSNLLWVAFGVNRKVGPDGAPGRTAASASNSQEIDLYIALEDGIYLYDAVMHRLNPEHQEPGLHDPEIQKSYYFVDTGLIAGNVYLFAAAHGLASWFHNCDKTMLTKSLALRPEQRVLFAQSIGWPAAAEARQ